MPGTTIGLGDGGLLSPSSLATVIASDPGEIVDEEILHQDNGFPMRRSSMASRSIST